MYIRRITRSIEHSRSSRNTTSQGYRHRCCGMLTSVNLLENFVTAGQLFREPETETENFFFEALLPEGLRVERKWQMRDNEGSAIVRDTKTGGI